VRLTGIAALAVSAAFALSSCGGADEPDRYTLAANRICTRMATKLEQLEHRWRSHPNHADPGDLARPMFTIVGDERVRLAALKAPKGQVVLTVELDQDLLNFENRLTDLIHLESLSRHDILATARTADAAGVEARKAASELGLARCASLPLAVSSSFD